MTHFLILYFGFCAGFSLFLILYFGFCAGFSLSSNMSVNEEIIQGNVLGDPIKWYEILFGMLMSSLTVPIAFFILLRNKIDK